MNIEVQAALVGAGLGAILSYAGMYFLEYGNGADSRRIVKTLFKFIHNECKKVISVGDIDRAVQKKNLLSLISSVEKIRDTLLSKANEKELHLFMEYNLHLDKLNDLIQAGSHGRINPTIEKLNEIFSQLESL